jgi:hypothetical protein
VAVQRSLAALARSTSFFLAWPRPREVSRNSRGRRPSSSAVPQPQAPGRGICRGYARRDGPTYHPLTVAALHVYQQISKVRCRPIPDADADLDYASAADFAAFERSTHDPVVTVRNYVRELCAEQLARARTIRAAMRASRSAWQGENGPLDLADAQRRIWLYREDRRAFVAAAARAAATAPPATAAEARRPDRSPVGWVRLQSALTTGLDDGDGRRRRLVRSGLSAPNPAAGWSVDLWPQEWVRHPYADTRSVVGTARQRSGRTIEAIRSILKGKLLKATT